MGADGFSGLEKRFFDNFLWIAISLKAKMQLSAFTLAFGFRMT
jgi:hypothetical protein